MIVYWHLSSTLVPVESSPVPAEFCCNALFGHCPGQASSQVLPFCYNFRIGLSILSPLSMFLWCFEQVALGVFLLLKCTFASTLFNKCTFLLCFLLQYVVKRLGCIHSCPHMRTGKEAFIIFALTHDRIKAQKGDRAYGQPAFLEVSEKVAASCLKLTYLCLPTDEE